MNDLTGKTALITGASRGIGQAIALTLGAAGAKIFATATSEKGAQNITKTLKDAGIDGEGLVLNVSNDEQIIEVNKTINAVDILVNNAGITRDNLLMRMKDDEWDDIINTNLRSVYKMSKAVLRSMMKQKSGRIISIASVVGSMGNAGQTNYAAAKAGIMGFTKSLAREVGSRGVTVNAIAPGFIKTAMTDALSEGQKEILSKQIPMGKFGSTQDVANCVLFLAGQGGDYITAQTLHVNGGMYTV